MVHSFGELNNWLAHWEPTWLLLVLVAELLVGIYSGVILTVEYWYDKEFNDNIKAARKERRRKKYEFEQLTEGEHR